MKQSDTGKERGSLSCCAQWRVARSVSVEKKKEEKTALNLEVCFEYLDVLDMIYTTAKFLTAQ